MIVRLLVATMSLVLLAGCGGGDSDDAGGSGDPAPKAQTPTPLAEAAPCEYVATPDPSTEDIELPPTQPEAVPSMTISTNRGDIKVTFNDTAPCAVNSFVSLANQGYFDGVSCHRLVPEFVLQCGDPTGTGKGGPGYSFKDELTGQEQYTQGTFAMANAGPNTNGSQFFIVLADTVLDPSYTVFGTVDADGMKVAQAIEAEGNASGTERPKKDVIMEWVR